MDHSKTQNPPKLKTPVLPNWCNYTATQKITCIGVFRAVLAAIVFITCVVFLETFELSLGVHIIVIEFMILHIAQFIVIVYVTSRGRSGNLHLILIRRWIIFEIVISVIFIISVLALLCSMRLNTVILIMGITLMFIYGIVCYKHAINYMNLQEPYQLQA